MIKIIHKGDCCGCTACYNSCPTKAIVMKEDHEGFKYPVIDEGKCIDCGLCEKVCPMKVPAQSEGNYGGVYAIQNNDITERKQSTAGGFFSVIADKILEEGGVVCAAGWKHADYIMVSHKLISEKQQMEELRGSKYVQSDLGDCFTKIKELIKKGTRCLFVGTPCQVQGIRKFLGYNKLLVTIDLLCLGVSSPRIFEMWMEYLESKYQEQVAAVYFRDKSFGYSTANVKIKFVNGKTLEQRYDAKSYLRTFFHGYNIRPSCYKCNFRCELRVSDFTIGDFHQISRINKSMDDDLGTTAVWINSEQGKELFSQIQDRLTLHMLEETHDGIVGKIGKLTKIPGNREEFYQDVERLNYRKLIKKWEPNSATAMIINVFKIVINKTPLRTVVFKAIKRRKAKKFEKRVNNINRE